MFSCYKISSLTDYPYPENNWFLGKSLHERQHMLETADLLVSGLTTNLTTPL